VQLPSAFFLYQHVSVFITVFTGSLKVTYNVFSGTLNPTHSLTHSLESEKEKTPFVIAGTVFFWPNAFPAANKLYIF